VVIGIGGAVAYTIGAKTCLALRIDDPVNASAVHFFAGAWGLIAPALFAKESNMIAAYAISGQEGMFYGGGARPVVPLPASPHTPPSPVDFSPRPPSLIPSHP